ncbi:MAG TPA: tetratricopeptide repeat protein, partial [Ardenticatenaceae bacterium]|nr:tetratricopeptide repeat protein [Ardenticatenaceae bacterium]
MRDLKPFGAWLKQRRTTLDLTREQLAQQAHCSVSALRRLEAGTLRASRELAEALCAALAVPPEQSDAFVRFARGERGQWQGGSAEEPEDRADPSATQAPSNLPAPLTALIGRRREVAAVSTLLRSPGVRLLTLTGPPGTGKTRLSLRAARELEGEFQDGIFFVPLAPLTDSLLVVGAIAQSLGVSESPGRALMDVLKDVLRPKRLLLVLDNFEQVIGAAPLLTDLLAATPGVKALVTSRAVLHVYGEHEFPVPPLDFPDAQRLPTTLATSYFVRYAAVQLFRERARAVTPGFRLTPENAADVARICSWLDGLPLAIEMAAAQVKWLPVDRLFAQLSNRLALLTGGPHDLSPRQHSLAGAIDWSYELLAVDEQRLFCLLGLFAGGADVEAIQGVNGAMANAELRDAAPGPESDPALIDRLGALAEKSLLVISPAPNGESRYSMLETLREYTLEKLRASGQLEPARKAHAEHYARLALSARPHLMGDGEQQRWLDRLEIEHNNLRAALTWATGGAGRGELALTLAEASFMFWRIRGYLSEGRRWLEKALLLSETPTELRGQALNDAGWLAQFQGEYAAARGLHEEALAIHEALGDEVGMARSLESLAVLAGRQGEYARAAEIFEQSLVVKRRAGNSALLTTTLNNLALAHRRLGNLARAEELYCECATLARATDNRKSLSHALHGQADVRVELGDDAGALALYRESIAIRHQLGNRTELVNSFEGIARPFLRLGVGLTAARLLSAAA